MDLTWPISISPLLKNRVSFAWDIAEKGRIRNNNQILMLRMLITNGYL
jgi:hypothetical protein